MPASTSLTTPPRRPRSSASILASLNRLVPSLLMAASVALLTAGVMSFAPSAFGEWRTPEPSLGGGDPLFGGLETPPPGGPGRSPIEIGPSPTPLGVPTGSPAPGSTLAPKVVASRIRIPALDIDLPVVAGDIYWPGNRDLYPLCDVAMYMPEFAQPGDRGTTYIYAHAQRGMFLPLLRASTVDDGQALIGAVVEVYTTSDELHLYEISQVKRHATDLSLASDAQGVEQLVLQTSEGPTGTLPKLQVAATPISTVRSTTADARPSPQPRVCAPDS